MSGHSIESEDFVIVVDKWDASFLKRPGCKPHYFFLTHLHADHIKGLTSTWSRTIYTSPFNAWLLPMRRNVKQVLLKEVELNVTHTIRKANNEIAFQVTLLDANHCPGAVMFLFQGKFGNILYTGDFRYTRRILDNPILSPIIRNKELSVLYLDNTYAAANCKFPTREEALKEVLKIIDENPDSKILIGMRQLGKEEVLRAIALHVNEKVCVSNQRLQILSKLEYEDVFTSDVSQSRIHAVELHSITLRHCQESSKTVSIKLTSMYECCNGDRQRGNIHVVPYSDHSSHTELKEFVDHLRPLKLYPIVIPKFAKVPNDAGPWHKMSAVNCVMPDEILELCGPSSENGASTLLPAMESPLRITYHPAPRPASVEKKSTSVTYIDEGMSFLPFESMESHLINNNKARKNIKANWTRLAPKLFVPKGIQYESSPEKSLELSKDSVSISKEVDECSLDVIGPTTNKGDILPAATVKDEHSLLEVPLSDDDLDELDMPSSASELVRRMNLTTNQPVNGVASEDRKSECSSEITDLFEDTSTVRMTRNRSKGESPAKGVNDSKDSMSDISSSKRTTRSKASVVSVPVSTRPRTRLSHGSDLDNHVDSDARSKSSGVRKSLRNSPKGASSVSPKSEKNGLDRKSVFLSPSLPRKKLNTKNVESTKVAENSKTLENAKNAKSIENTKNREIAKTLDTKIMNEDKQKKDETSDVSNINSSNPVPEGSGGSEISEIQTVGTSSNANSGPTLHSTSEICSESDTISKKTPNGNVLLTNFNGIHINSPGRKRVPISCDWDAAQEIAKKETEQALKALETLDQMKGFKTRNVGNRSGVVAPLRRQSADSIPKSPLKKAVSPGIRRRTASILTSMATTFSQPISIKQEDSPSRPVTPVEEISPILPAKGSRSPRKAKLESPSKTGGKKSMGASKGSETRLASKNLEKVAVDQSTSSSNGSQVKDTIEVQVPALPITDSEDLPSSVPAESERGEPILLPKVERRISNDSEASKKQPSGGEAQEPHGTVDSSTSADAMNQGLFLTDETLASSSSSSKKVFKQPRRTFYKKQTEVNVNLMKLKMDFAMSRKGPKRLSLPSRLSLLRRDVQSSLRQESPPASKEKVQDWKKKISMHLRKSPQRRYKFKSPSKLRESARQNLAAILRSGRSLNNSQEYHADVEDCTELSQPVSETKENSGYIADNEGLSQSQSSPVSPTQRQTRSSLQSSISESSVKDSDSSIMNEVRRSSRLLKEDVNRSQVPSKPAKSWSKNNPKQEDSKTFIKSSMIDSNPPQKKPALLPTDQNSQDEAGGSSEAISATRFSDRLSERSRMITSKGNDKVLALKSPNILSLMADAFQTNTAAFEPPTTANILSGMAENFKKLDDGTKVSPSLSIQLVTSKVPVVCRPPKDKNSTDWGVQITRVDGASKKSQTSSQSSSRAGLSLRNNIPKSLSIEIIPESVVDNVPRKGPSPPTVTISPEVIDLGGSDSFTPDDTQSTLHSLPLPPGPRQVPQGAASRWRSAPKSEILSPPQAVWREDRSSSQTGEKVVIDIRTQEDPQKVPHCPVHCTCGAAMRQGTCMGTMRNLIEEDADCLYEVPLSPEDFEESGAMLAMGRGWIESCFEDPEDRDEFFQSYEDILPTVSDFKQRRTKPLPTSAAAKSSGGQPQPQPQPVRRVLNVASTSASPKPVVQNVKPAVQNVRQPPAATASTSFQTTVKKEMAVSSQVKPTQTKQVEQGKKTPASGTLLKEIEKKIKAYHVEQTKKVSGQKTVPSRRTSAQSTSSSTSASRSRPPLQRSRSPAAPPAPKEKKRKMNTSSSGSESPETKRTRCNELQRLSIDTGKNSDNRRYRVSVRRSLDQLMTRQKLRSDRRVKAPSTSRS